MTRRALVTGGAKGIGLGTAQHLAAQGWQVDVLDTDAEALAALDGITGHLCDVSNEAAVAGVLETLALDRLDLLVNNAGRANPVTGQIEELALADWRAMLDSHLTGAFLVTRACVPALRAAKGSIVNIASTRALMSEPDTEAYAAAKGALTAFTHALAVSLGPDIRANAILPGWIEVGALRPGGAAAELTETDHAQHPAGRVGTARDVAETVAWLADAGFVTGTQVVVDGGMTRKMIYAD
ncbi:SDR family oxidoreductase [Pontivivens ytuae]|uniref:SDR family oxidoreductase n=1 Tax=Pontivivens ytuae TaxID=2789856 RepID=A0A7S9LS62_9RHOB|nr:SDR family oxidoreductase [Pontivivens ytuae]QPH54316.1 SDR family oxidoreductase [Pontivivens ytuae]